VRGAGGRLAADLDRRRLSAMDAGSRPVDDSTYAPGVHEDTARRGHPFDQVVPRRSVDELFRNLSQALVSYTGQADLKANIVITGSSLVLTIVATRWTENSLRPGLITLAVFALAALLTAITVVLPKFRLHRRGEVRHDFEPHENPLFFGHFASMPRDRFVEILAEIAADDAALYEVQAADIHDQGRYLVEKKYRHLRLAYIFLGLAFLAGAVVQGIASLT
jgi:hypothetical protein